MTENDVGNNVLGFGDDREMQRLIKMANVLANDNIKKKSDRQSLLAFDNISTPLQAVQPKPEIKTDTPPKPTVSAPVQNTTPEMASNLSTTSTLTNIQMFSIFGFKLPKSTLYFILVAIAVAVIFYYWTSSPRSARSPSTDEAVDQSGTEQDE
jgi:hypothetical protein